MFLKISKSFALSLLLWLCAAGLACTPTPGTNPDLPTNESGPQSDTPEATGAKADDTEPAPTQTQGDDDDTTTNAEDTEAADDDGTSPTDETPPEPEPEPATCSIDFNTFPTGTSFFSAFGDDGYEPSGAVWNATTQTLFTVSDDGVVSNYDPATGVVENSPTIPYNLEGITIADESSSVLYLGVEDPHVTGLEGHPLILEYDFSTQSVLRSFDLQSVMDTDGSYTAANLGLEALAFVPNATSAEGGYFYAGLQATGEVFVIELPLVTDTLSTTVTPITTLPAVRAYISDLTYAASEDALYATYDPQQLSQLSLTDGTEITAWTLPVTTDVEALAIDTDNCHVFLGQDLSSAGTGIEGEFLEYDF